MDFQFLTFEPEDGLRDVVRQSFYARGRIPYRTDKILPTGLISLLFTLGNSHRTGKNADSDRNAEFSHSWLSGIQTTPLYHTPLDDTHVIGILFEPPGFRALFNANMVDLKDQTIDPRNVLPVEFIALVASLYPRASERDAHSALFHWLIQQDRALVPEWVFDIYGAIIRTRGDVDLVAWYEKSGHSTRHAIDVFRSAVGITPKVLCRIHRLTALLEAVDPEAINNWADLAHEYGFYDQAHFNHEFRKLCGLHPSEYLEQRKQDLPQLKKGESVAFAPQR